MITFDPDGLERRAAELEVRMGEPGFWNDQQSAAQISSEHARVQKRLERYERLRREYDDARELLAMDGDMAGEIETSLKPLESELERLQEDALFSGDYDADDAVVTIQSDAGGCVDLRGRSPAEDRALPRARRRARDRDSGRPRGRLSGLR